MEISLENLYVNIVANNQAKQSYWSHDEEDCLL